MSLQNIPIQINSVYDADTFRGTVKGMGRFATFGENVPFRLYGIDTPERGWRAKCDRERLLASEARELVIQLTSDAQQLRADIEETRDKYGRWLVTLWVDEVNLNQLLVERNLAHWYDGGTKQSWCE